MKISNEKGLSTIAVVGIMVIMAFFGTAVVYQLTTSQAMRSNQVLSDEAFYVTQAGLEYAVRKIYEGESPVVAEPGKGFSDGNFVISQDGQVITVVGRVGEARVTHTMTSPTQADCTRLNVSNAQLTGDDGRLSQIKVRKICLTQTVIDKMIFSWVADGGERLKKIRIESSTLYNDATGVTSGSLIDVADYVMSNTNENNFNEINFSASMEGKTFEMTLVMGDTTTKVATFTPD